MTSRGLAEKWRHSDFGICKAGPLRYSLTVHEQCSNVITGT